VKDRDGRKLWLSAGVFRENFWSSFINAKGDRRQVLIGLGFLIRYQMTTFHNLFLCAETTESAGEWVIFCWYDSFSGKTKNISILFKENI
jgi:hypothetical protein